MHRLHRTWHNRIFYLWTLWYDRFKLLLAFFPIHFPLIPNLIHQCLKWPSNGGSMFLQPAVNCCSPKSNALVKSSAYFNAATLYSTHLPATMLPECLVRCVYLLHTLASVSHNYLSSISHLCSSMFLHHFRHMPSLTYALYDGQLRSSTVNPHNLNRHNPNLFTFKAVGLTTSLFQC